MATYVYRCQACGAVFEVSRSMFSEENTTACDSCESLETLKIPTAPATVVDWKNVGDEGVVVGPDRFRGPAVPKSIQGG